MNKRLEGLIVRALVAHGWTASDGTAIASKVYRTAVGDKLALVYLGEFHGSGTVMLQGTYFSEGSNVIENALRIIPLNASAAAVKEIVASFHEQTDRQIRQSYAARLLRIAA